ncbi:MAG: DNA-directed RNA polymerase subunit alpha [Phycisphaerae bacterium]
MRIRWRGLELPTRLMQDDAASKGGYGRFIIEPFERGFGTTVGNSLRRILLSSLEGAAVTQVKIKGADHEFMTIPGVMEDVTEIILNIKSMIVESTSDSPKTMRLSVKGKSGETVPVLASDLEVDPALKVVQGDHVLATLTDDISFEMELVVARGRSYVTAEEHKAERDSEEQEIGIIHVDSVFSPVTRVRYRVEDTRVGQRTNFDRLIMEIWTNGTVTPKMALVESAKILRKHLNPFVQRFELGSGLALEASDKDAGSDEPSSHGDADAAKLAMPISALELSVRSNNCLTSANINTVGELLSYDTVSLLNLRSFGRTSLREVQKKLADHGLSLVTPEDAEGMGSSDEQDKIEQPMADGGERDQIDSPLSSSGFSRGSASSLSGIPPLDSGTMSKPTGQDFPPPSESQTTVSTDTPANSEVGSAPKDAG